MSVMKASSLLTIKEGEYVWVENRWKSRSLKQVVKGTN